MRRFKPVPIHRKRKDPYVSRTDHTGAHNHMCVFCFEDVYGACHCRNPLDFYIHGEYFQCSNFRDYLPRIGYGAWNRFFWSRVSADSRALVREARQMLEADERRYVSNM